MKHIHDKRISNRDKKVSRLRTLSQISRNEMAFLINAINNIYSTMHRENSNPKILKQLGRSALTTSKLIKNAVDVDKCIIDEFENDVNDKFDEFQMKDFKRIVAFKRKKNMNSKQNKNKKCMNNNNNSSVNDIINDDNNSFDNDEDYKLYVFQKQKFDKMLKLQELQGEILLHEQKKKYSLRDKFENKIVYPTSHFLRSPISTNKYKYVISSLTSNYLYSNTPHNKTKSLSSFNNNNNNNNVPISKSISSSNLQHKRTLSSKCIRDKNHKVRIIIPSSTNHSRPLSSLNTFHYNNKSTRNQLLSYIDCIEKEALSENESLKQPPHNNNNSSRHSLRHSSSKLHSPLLKEHCTQHTKALKHKCKRKHKPTSLFEGINENDLVKSNAANVNKYLDANGRKLLHNVVGQVIYEHGKAMIPHDKCSIYSRKTLSHKLNKTFKQVCKQTLSIQHDYFIDGVIGDTPSQDKYISNICKGILTKEKHSESSQHFSLMKSKLFHPRSSVYGDNNVVDTKRKKIKKSTSCINLNNNNNKQY